MIEFGMMTYINSADLAGCKKSRVKKTERGGPALF